VHRLLSTLVIHEGVATYAMTLGYGGGPPDFQPFCPQVGGWDFKEAAPEKVGGREAKVVTCNAVLLGDTCQVTLWIDAETMLPLKRLIVYEGNRGKPGRITEICTFNLNPKVDAGAFALPK